jgi:hypothetical protein
VTPPAPMNPRPIPRRSVLSALAKPSLRAYIGIDPGASGGLVLIRCETIEAVPMPDTERDVWDWIRGAREVVGERGGFAVIEQVGGHTKDQRGTPGMGSAMFKFGMSYGGLRMALIAAGIPFQAVSAPTWHRGLSLSPRKRDEARTAYKNRLKARAQELYPQFKVTLAIADALLIATYCARTFKEEL